MDDSAQITSYHGETGANHPVNVVESANKIMTGRIPKITPELVADIIESLKNGETVEQTCKNVGISKFTFYSWCKVNSAFSDAIASAREFWTHSIVDKGLHGLVNADAATREDMVKVKKAEAVAKFSMEIASRLNPKDYAAKQHVQMDVRSVSITTKSDRLRELLDE